MEDLKIYISSPPELASEAARLGPVSLMAYDIGRGLRLMRSRNMPSLGGERLMEVSCRRLTGFGPQEALAESILRQCLIYGFSGAVLDLPRKTQALLAFAQVLSDRFRLRGLDLYLPEGFAGSGERHRVLVGAQNYFGTFSARLELLARRYGPERLALCLEPRPADFALPCRQSLPPRLSSPVPGGAVPGRTFYSKYHEANYMTYSDRGRAHLVMWDDPASLKRKLAVAKSLGIRTAFIRYEDSVGMLL